MKTLRIEVFNASPSLAQLRFFADGNPQPRIRDLAPAELTDFCQRSLAHYQDGLSLQALGKTLFDWLHGKEGYLDGYSQDTVLYIPSSPLGEVAWELLHNGGYLCANLHHPFSPLRRVSASQRPAQPKNRPLRLLFMASSPEDVRPRLQFEQEEALILTATRASNLELVVEESGSLEGLSERISDGDATDSFDVVHITGHADIINGQPIFWLEDGFGQAQLADADAIAGVFSRYERFPRLLFLSGCKTAQASAKALPSLCEALVLAGVPAVLGWAKPVGDLIASFTAQELYQLLAEGVDLGRAVSLTRQVLYREEQRLLQTDPTYKPQWHLLRFYSDDTPLTALAIKGKRRAVREIRQEFLDNNVKIEVCPREAFVGRRRLLQQALRALRRQQGEADYAEGVVLTGMGGLGKSSLAVRICQRLEHYLSLCFIASGKVDETVLRDHLGKKWPKHAPAINEILNQQQDLTLRLCQLFGQFPEFDAALFVFDDFEQNFRADDYQNVEPIAYEIITALLTAIRQTGSPSRVLITSRYAVVVTVPLRLADIALSSFQGADLDKKTAALRLSYLPPKPDTTTLAQEQQAIKLAAGNPRLLERLYQVVASDLDTDALFAQLAQKQAEFREELLLTTLLSYQNAATRRLIAGLALFEVFIPETVLATVLDLPDFAACLHAALAVGLVESSAAGCFVSRLLLPLLAGELDEAEQRGIYSLAAEGLYGLWWESDYVIGLEEHAELSRVAKRGRQQRLYSQVTGALANRLQDLCRYDEAKGLYEALLPIYQSLGDRKGEGFVYNQIALIQHLRGDYATALAYYQQALPIAQELGNKQGEGATLNNISQIYKAQGDYGTALRYLELSLPIWQAIGDKKGEGATLNNLATTAHAQGDYGTVLRYLEESLQIWQAIGDKKGEGVTLNNISQIYDAQGDYGTALRYLEQSLQICQAIGDKSQEGTTLNNIFSIYHAQGDYGTALRYLEQSLQIRQDIGDTAGECATLFNIGHIHLQNDEQKQALSIWLQAYRIAKHIGWAQALQNLDQLAKALGGEGLAYWEERLSLAD
ncbi:tetratricopeptide repeat protein [Methylovulum psychrotolerans]|uniref:tetratricopeptide repeat protein n=1 Tax=Methylovulum psychrotolerans TaxID=1704499 RepID=UPI001BFF9A3C|nr:tetratricopeptide repeat protein [Methylovulum psychrotolerans]MBT9096432.1 tetratricopeptide repeat protein [Methylovulum psychrotolerans]